MTGEKQQESGVLEEILLEGLRDWNYVGWVQSLCIGEAKAGELSVRDAAIGTIAQGFALGLIEPGDVDGEGRFTVWEGDVKSWLKRIIDEWTPGLAITPGLIAWLNNTEHGDEVARRVLARRQE